MVKDSGAPSEPPLEPVKSREVWLPPEPNPGKPPAYPNSPTPAHGTAAQTQLPTPLSVVPIAPARETMATLSEARNQEVASRPTDFGGPPTLPQVNNRVVLLRMDGVSAGQVFTIENLPCTMGRHPTNQLSIDDTSISRHHARVRCENGEYFIDDLNSCNGTFVQGKRVSSSRLVDDDWIQLGPRVGFRFFLTDIRQERLLRRLYESSTRDALTGAFNRMHFADRLEAEVAFALRHSTEASLVLLDIDHFKKVNDTYGHPAGDAVLRHVAQVCIQSLRTEDVFCRFGGEEFAVLLRGIPCRGAGRLAERLRVAVAETPGNFEDHVIPVTLSLGCASVALTENPSGATLVQTADRRLYMAKNQGRNRVIASD